MTSDSSRSRLWGIFPLALVVVALLGSVAVPARQTWVITDLLRETTEVLAPARLLVARLQSGLAEEIGALNGYALSHDSALLERYRSTAAADDRRLASINALAVRLDATSAGHVVTVGRRINDWRQVSGSLVEHPRSKADFAAAIPAVQASYDASLSAIADLSADLAAGTAARDNRVRVLEHFSLISNAGLVLAALAALFGVTILTLRERRLASALHRRVEEESALRQLARALSAAVTIDEALQCTVKGAIATTGAFGTYVEWMIPRDHEVEVIATVGADTPTLRIRGSYSGSLTEDIIARGNPIALAADAEIAVRLAARLGDSCPECTSLVAPLFSGEETLGVLVLIRDGPAPAFGEDEQRQIRLIGDLASATLRRVAGMATERRALEDARRCARQEGALREAAEALAGAFTIDDVTQQIAHAALKAMEGRGTFIEEFVARPGESSDAVIVRAVSGAGVPPLESICEFAGSYTEQVTTSGEPLLITDLGNPPRIATVCALQETTGAAIVVPLGGPRTATRALFVLSPPRGHFRSDDVERAAIFGHLAALAYEKVRLLDEAYEGRRKLERVIQSRSRLMRGFSHDVKNPIGAADGYAELLIDGIYGELSSEQHETVKRIRRSIHGALTLIDDLHELARAETGNLALPLGALDLADLVRTIGEEYQATARASGLSLSVTAESDLPVLQTSGTRVRQIASNLLSNAIKYTEQGSVTVRALRRRSGPGDGDDYEVVEFIDTGPGIPPEKQEFIFEEFSRIGGDTKPGAGLGLAISRTLAEALGGHISVDSEMGHGSTFTLWLPLHSTRDPVPESQSASLVRGIGGTVRRARETELPSS
ncbi:MAG: ATP-binding protein [Gemmatimonadaceae bacterium]